MEPQRPQTGRHNEERGGKLEQLNGTSESRRPDVILPGPAPAP